MKKVFTTETMERILCLSDLQLSPDEQLIAYVENRSDAQDGAWYPRVCVVDRASGGGVFVCCENSSEKTKNPRFSPDGTLLYFLSDLSGEMQIYAQELSALRACISAAPGDALIPFTAPNAQKMTALRHGIKSFTIGANGAHIAFECSLWEDEIATGSCFGEMTREEKIAWEEEKQWAPIEITQIDYKRDELFGCRDGSIERIGILNTGDASVRLIPCGHPLSSPAISPDGKMICCYGQPHTGPFFSRKELFTAGIDTSGLCCLTDGSRLCDDAPPAFTADMQHILFPAYAFGEEGGFVEALYKIPVGGGEKVCLFDCENDTVSSGVYAMPCCRTEYGARRSYYEQFGDRIYFLGAMNGTQRLFSIGMGEKQIPEEVLSGEYSIHEACPVKNGGFVLMRGDYATIKDLYEAAPDGSMRRIRNSNAWMDAYALGEVIRRRVPSKDGKVTVYSAVAKPAAFEEGKKYPAVLYLHGGPEVCYSVDFWHEVQILANAGYAVVFCDPRGSAGYGMRFCAGELAWGDEAYDDMIACLEDAVSLGFIDPDRVGITGGSYGGYMTSKIIMMTDRFKAAVGQRIFVNKATSYGTGDIGFYSAGKRYDQIRVRDCLVERARTSIIRNMDKIKTPLLLLHGYNDYRCSFEQSEQLFISIKERLKNVPVKLVMFPGENHNVSRTGLLQHRMRHVQEMVDWFDRFLKEAE